MSKWTSVASRASGAIWPAVLAGCVLATPAPASAALIITGVVDGDEAGGVPKGIELYATAHEPDLSIYSIGRYTNGGSRLEMVTALDGSLQRGEFYYITGVSSDEHFAEAGLPVDLSSKAVANINGNDLLSIVSTSDYATAFDTFGLPGQGEANFYADAIAYRIGGSGKGDPVGSIDAVATFAIEPWTGSDQLAQTFGSFQASAVPEPSSLLALSTLASLAFVRNRLRPGD